MIHRTLATVIACLWLAPLVVSAGQSKPASFFITSVGKNTGGDLGGLAGADAHCQALAKAAGYGNRTWRAYLSTQGPNAVNARDRIGKGPWYNLRGELVARDVEDLHRNQEKWARVVGQNAHLLMITEKNTVNPGEHDPHIQHEVLTGSQPDGRAFTDGADHTCNSWTGKATTGKAQLGHGDLLSNSSEGLSASWNSAHETRNGCSQEGIEKTHMSVGQFYCFAAD